MEVKIGNTKIINNVRSANFKSSQIGDQLLCIDSYYKDVMINNENIDKEIDEYAFYFVNDLKYNNSLINLLCGRLSFDFWREYEENDPSDELTSAGEYTEKESDGAGKISIISINSKNFIYDERLVLDILLNDESKDNYGKCEILEKIHREVNNSYLYKANAGMLTTENKGIRKYYHYLINDISNGLYACFIIEYRLDMESKLFDKNKFCIICDKENYSEINESQFFKLFEFIEKNNDFYPFKEESEKNIEMFKNKLEIFNYKLSQIITNNLKIQVTSLMNYDLSYDDYYKQLLPVYVNDETNLKFYILKNINSYKNEYAYIINGKSAPSYMLEKIDKEICNELSSYYKMDSPIVNVFNGEIINTDYSIIYKDVEHMIIKGKKDSQFCYYKFLNGYAIRIENNTWRKENNDQIKEIKDKFELIKKLEEEESNDN